MALDSNPVVRSRSQTLVVMEKPLTERKKHSSVKLPMPKDVFSQAHTAEIQVKRKFSKKELPPVKSASDMTLDLHEGLVRSATFKAFRMQSTSFRHSQGITPRSFEQASGDDLQERINNIAVVSQFLLAKTSPNNILDLGDKDLIIVCNTEEKIYKFSRILSVIINDLESAINQGVWQAVSFDKEFTLGHIIDNLIKAFKEKIPDVEFADKQSTIKTLENLYFKLDFEVKRKNSQDCKDFAKEVMRSYVEKNEKHYSTKFFIHTLLSMYHDDKKDLALQDVISSDAFLLTYKTVGSSRKLFRSILKTISLLDEYKTDRGIKVLARVYSQKKIIYNFMAQWIRDRNYSKDLKDVEPYFKSICELSKEKYPATIAMLEDLYKQECLEQERSSFEIGIAGIYPLKIDSNFSIVDEIANDLKHIYVSLYSQLNLSDMLQTTDNPSWQSIIDLNNHLANFVTYSILRGSPQIDVETDDVASSFKRSKSASKLMIHFFVKLSLKCVEDKNFEIAQAIFNGLNHVVVEKHMEKMKLFKNIEFDRLNEIFSLENNQKGLRDLLKQSDKKSFHTLSSQIFCKDHTNLISNQLKIENEYNVSCLMKMADILQDHMQVKKLAKSIHVPILTSFQSLLDKFVKLNFNLDVNGKMFLKDYKY